MNVSRRVIVTALLCLPLCGRAQTPAAPLPPTTQQAPLFVTPRERRFFTLGLSLSQAAFAHAGVTRRASRLSRTHNLNAKVNGLTALAPDANAARLLAQDALSRAATLLPDMDTPPDVSSPIERLSAQMARPLALTGDAAAVAPLNADAARTLASLGEARQLSDLLNAPALKAWLKSPALAKDEPVWYAEGVLAGMTEAAAVQELPGLLPPAADLATDLRGLRDWLSGRLPETPTPEQNALQDALSGFVQGTAGKGHTPTLTAAQLHALGDISRMLQAQMLQAQMLPPQTIATH